MDESDYADERDRYASFLVRLWRSAEPKPRASYAGWHGEIEHIQSGQRRQFTNLEDLLGYIGQQPSEHGEPGAGTAVCEDISKGGVP